MILSSAALIGVSFRNLVQVPDGFESKGLLVARVQLTTADYTSTAARTAFGVRLIAALESEPDLLASGFTSTLPVGDQRTGMRFFVELPDGSLDPEPLLLHIRRISDAYTEVMGLPLLRGRLFDSRDGGEGLRVALVSSALAERLWPGEDPVGKPLHRVVAASEAPQVLEVVGVVGNVMDGGYEAPPGETVYLPWAQNSITRLSIVVRPRGSPETARAALRRALVAANPALAAGAHTAACIGAGRACPPRLQSILLATFALVATGIVVLGSYGLMSQLVASREREFALRVAVGASRGQIGTAVLIQAARIGAAPARSLAPPRPGCSAVQSVHSCSA